MRDYPSFDGTQACQEPSPAAAVAFSGTISADPMPALALCSSCLFAQERRTWALTNDVHGVWGGTTESVRDEIRSQLRLPAPPSISDDLDQLVIALRESRNAASLAVAS